MKYAAIILVLAAAGVLALGASLFDAATLIVVVIALATVGLFGTLPVLFDTITRRAEARGKSGDESAGDDVEVVRFESNQD